MHQREQERIEKLGNAAFVLSCLSAVVYLFTSLGIRNTLADVSAFIQEALRRTG